MGIVIDNEFKSLIPPLTDDEYDGLRDSILSEGCRDALVLWGDTLIDGHNRYKICEKHGIPYDTIEIEFRNRDEAKLWIYKNQLSRRNLNDFQRIEITHKVEDAVKAMAEERMKAGKADPCVNLRKGRASEELGAMAGVSGSTLIACEQLDRRCFMMEISEHYCDVIIKRWEEFTGQKAELVEE